MSDNVRSPNAGATAQGDVVRPQARTFIKLYESDNKIMLDISDETRGLGWLVDLDPVVASQLGQRMSDMARNVVAKISESPDRSEVYVIKNPIPQDYFVQPARLSQSRIRKPRRVRSNGNGQLGLPTTSPK